MPATSGGGTGPTRPFAGVVGRRTAPAPPGRSLPRRCGARPWATCSTRPGAAEPSRTVGRSPLVPRSGSFDGAARGFGRRVTGWPALDLRRPDGSRQATVGLPPALPPVSSGIRRTGHWVRAQPHASAVFSKRSTKASGSSWGPIFISGTWAIDGDATGVSSRPSKLRMARRSSSCAWTKSRKRSSCSSFMSMNAWCCAWWRPASDLTSSASGVGWAGCMTACRLPRPGFRHQCSKVRGSRKEDEEVRGDEPQIRCLITQIKIATKHKHCRCCVFFVGGSLSLHVLATALPHLQAGGALFMSLRHLLRVT